MAIYLRGGRFNKDAMPALIQDALKIGTTLDFPLTRMIAHAEIALDGWSSGNEWVEYEMLLNDVLPNYDEPVIRIYDINMLNANLAVDILRTVFAKCAGAPQRRARRLLTVGRTRLCRACCGGQC
jgi:hypothetical protein